MPRSNARAEVTRQLVIAGVLLVLAVVVGAVGYHTLGDGRWAWGDCFYMTVITLSTVGYGEILPGMNELTGARTWTLFLIIGGSGSLLLFVSTLTAFIVEGDIEGVFRRKRMQKKIQELEDHIVVVGVGAVGSQVAAELHATHEAFVVVELDQGRIDRMLEDIGSIPYVHGDATDDHVLEQAGLLRARGLATTLPEDKDNLFIAITARALNPNLRIAARVTEGSAQSKLKRAGADAIVSPSAIGGMRIASELVRPTVVQFFDRMRSHDLRVEEVPIPNESPLIGARLRDTTIRHEKSVLVLAVREQDGSYAYNPGPDYALEAGQTLVVLCRTDELNPFRDGVRSGTIGLAPGLAPRTSRTPPAG